MVKESAIHRASVAESPTTRLGWQVNVANANVYCLLSQCSHISLYEAISSTPKKVKNMTHTDKSVKLAAKEKHSASLH